MGPVRHGALCADCPALAGRLNHEAQRTLRANAQPHVAEAIVRDFEPP